MVNHASVFNDRTSEQDMMILTTSSNICGAHKDTWTISFDFQIAVVSVYKRFNHLCEYLETLRVNTVTPSEEKSHSSEK